MCGIAGIIGPQNENRSDLLRSMLKAIIHRGPDEHKIIRKNNVDFIHTRLSIIDLKNGSQPFCDDDLDLCLIANGEIYNFIELRKNFKDKGRTFVSNSDCEVILHAYALDGVEGIKRLRGMFAFALYDGKRGKVILARDRMGEKPLYYSRDNSGLVFASELQGIIAGKKEPLQVDQQAVVDFFRYQYVPDPRSIFRGIKKLPRASIMTISLSDFSYSISTYWNPWKIEQKNTYSLNDLSEAFHESISISARSDVPLALSLSGGLDSSLIAACLAKASSQKVTAFCLGYEGRPENDERRYAEALSKSLGIEYEDIELKEDDIINAFLDTCFRRDEPVGDISGINYNAIMRRCNERGIKVIFAGQGADELFWGYEWVRKAGKMNNPKGSLFKQLFSLRNSSQFNMFNLQSFTQWELENENWMFPFSESFLIETPQETYGNLTGSADIDVMRLICDFYLIGNGIAQADRLSMSHSVEVCLPFLDHVFVEKAVAYQKGKEFFNKEPKLALKEISKNILPEKNIKRKKRGFSPPVKEWQEIIRLNLAEDFKEGYLANSGLLSNEAIDKLSSSESLPHPMDIVSRCAYSLEFTLRKHLN